VASPDELPQPRNKDRIRCRTGRRGGKIGGRSINAYTFDLASLSIIGHGLSDRVHFADQ
jgi:hypothetical protein